jgi:hypothetical protein
MTRETIHTVVTTPNYTPLLLYLTVLAAIAIGLLVYIALIAHALKQQAHPSRARGGETFTAQKRAGDGSA